MSESPERVVKPLRVCSINVRSVKNKADSVSDFVTSNDIDILAITESWLGSVIDKNVISTLVPTGYDFQHMPRPSGKSGGGVGVLYKSGLNLKITNSTSSSQFTHFEHMDCCINTGKVSFSLCVVYRPPPSKINGFKNTIFFDEWCTYLEGLSTLKHQLAIVGDLNFHLDNTNDTDARHFISLLDVHGLSQHVNGSTHRAGHTLDVVITRDYSAFVDSDPTVFDPCLCDTRGNPSGDHYAVCFDINVTKPLHVRRKITFRKFRAICVPDFVAELSRCECLKNVDGTADELAEAYNSSIMSVIDRHAPLCTKYVTLRPNAPWYTDELRQAKHERRRAERVWRRTRLTVHKEIFKKKSDIRNKLLIKTKQDYYCSKVKECEHDQKQLFNLSKTMMGEKGEVILPSCSSVEKLSNIFSDFFANKINKIRENVQLTNSCSDVMNADPKFQGCHLTEFRLATEVEVRKLILGAPNKSCSLDPLPTWLLKQCIDVLLPLITTIINKSLVEAKVPNCFKRSNIAPLLKKSGLDQENLKNYRPVSNLPFISKILEKVVAQRLQEHINTNLLQDSFQSAYRQFHSTETALLKVHSDIAEAMDQKSSSVLIMLDLSAAFDVIDHPILFSRLEHTFGLTSWSLQWMKSYLQQRDQCVKIGDATSEVKHLDYGVPQGSVLGPMIYCMFTRPVGEVAKRHDINYHCYADDTQIYMSFNPSDWEKTASSIQACVAEISEWMSGNMLKLNQDKTELIVFAPKNQARNLSDLKLTIGSNTIHAVPHVKNLGVIFDRELTMEKQVNAVVKSCYYQIRCIGQIRKYLTNDASRTLVQALVTSRLDYGNAMLCGLPKGLTDRLQRAQNSAARLITGTHIRDHITPVLQDLHWLPVQYRSSYKILVYTYKVLNGLAPVYLSEKIQRYQPTRALRSQSQNLLKVPPVRTANYGDRCLGRSSALLWNNLPHEIKCAATISTFKKHIKTYLFKSAYYI